MVSLSASTHPYLPSFVSAIKYHALSGTVRLKEFQMPSKKKKSEFGDGGERNKGKRSWRKQTIVVRNVLERSLGSIEIDTIDVDKGLSDTFALGDDEHVTEEKARKFLLHSRS